MIPTQFRLGICATVGLVALVVVAQAGYAQAPSTSPRNSLSVIAGVTQFDLSGTGTTPIFGVRYDREISRRVAWQGSLNTISPKEQLGQRNRYVLPEVQVQVQLPRETVRPYLGIGTGFFIGNNGARTRATYTGSLGTRVRVQQQPIDFVLELRLRGVGETIAGTTADWTAGLAYRF